MDDDIRDYDDYDPEGRCPECDDGEHLESACIDDMCHGGEVPCMHGDWASLPCSLCGRKYS